MSWQIGNQKIQKFEDYNSIVKELKGSIKEHEAKLTLVKFLRTNIGFTFELLTGIELLPIQEIVIKSMFLKDNGLVVACRGFSKSWLLAVYSILRPVFNPKSKICLVSANFRRSRTIIESAEAMVNGKKSDLLLDCFPNLLTRRNDIFSWKMNNGSEIFALPLSGGDGIRGTRSSDLLLDEGLLLSKEVIESILRPFLTAKQNYQEEKEIRTAEDELIKLNIIKESDRMSFPKNKFMIFSSASYEFQYLHEIYTSWIEAINRVQGEKEQPSYFVMRASYECLPERSFLDKTQIETAKQNGGDTSDYFTREYKSLFSREGGGYFNIRKMHECTVKAGEYPTVQLIGQKDYQYLLSCDPSYSNNKNSDIFGFGVYLLVPQEKRIILVHSYAKIGGELGEHFIYLVYLLTHFNIVFACIDDSGSEFISGFNESSIAKERGLSLNFIEGDFDKDEYLEEISKAKRSYNLTAKRIVYGQKFSGGKAIRPMHEHLQNQINAEKVWFASRLGAHSEEYKKAMQINLPFSFKNNNDQIYEHTDFIDEQDQLIDDTKAQTGLIEVSTTASGTLQYNLPQSLRRNSENRVRKDNFTCLLLAAYAAKHYFNMIFTEDKPICNDWIPRIIR